MTLLPPVCVSDRRVHISCRVKIPESPVPAAKLLKCPSYPVSQQIPKSQFPSLKEMFVHFQNNLFHATGTVDFQPMWFSYFDACMEYKKGLVPKNNFASSTYRLDCKINFMPGEMLVLRDISCTPYL
jgi:hypothetical protein